MAEILHDRHADQEHERVVRVSERVGMETQSELLAKMREASIELVCLSSEAEPKKFRVSAEQMDTLCEAWQSFKSWNQAYEAERARSRAALLDDVRGRIEALGGKVTAAKGEDDTFNVTFEGRWVHYSMSRVGLRGMVQRLGDIERTIEYGSNEGDDF